MNIYTHNPKPPALLTHLYASVSSFFLSLLLLRLRALFRLQALLRLHPQLGLLLHLRALVPFLLLSLCLGLHHHHLRLQALLLGILLLGMLLLGMLLLGMLLHFISVSGSSFLSPSSSQSSLSSRASTLARDFFFSLIYIYICIRDSGGGSLWCYFWRWISWMDNCGFNHRHVYSLFIDRYYI